MGCCRRPRNSRARPGEPSRTPETIIIYAAGGRPTQNVAARSRSIQNRLKISFFFFLFPSSFFFVFFFFFFFPSFFFFFLFFFFFVFFFFFFCLMKMLFRHKKIAVGAIGKAHDRTGGRAPRSRIIIMNVAESREKWKSWCQRWAHDDECSAMPEFFPPSVFRRNATESSPRELETRNARNLGRSGPTFRDGVPQRKPPQNVAREPFFPTTLRVLTPNRPGSTPSRIMKCCRLPPNDGAFFG